MEPRSLRVSGAHGLTLHALEWSREGTCLLFLHGFGNDCHVWDETAPLLAPHYRVLALDLRGHGESERDPQRRYEHEILAEDVESLLAGLGVGRVVVVGHSLGGRVAMHFAGRNPEHMAGLVIVDSGPELDTRGTTRIRMETESAKPLFQSVAEYETLLSELYPATSPRMIASLSRHWTRERPDGKFEPKLDPAFWSLRQSKLSPQELRLRAERESERLWKVLEGMPCPTLVVRGAASDVLSAEVADRMVDEALSNGQLAVIARASHSVMLDNPQAFNEALCNFALG